jgi:Protein of unknown function (DUF3037)
MPDETKMKECSLYLVHYIPDLVRGEFLNIGLFLHSPEERFLGCLFTDDLRRVKRFHPQADLDFLRELQQDFEQRIDEHSADLEGYVRWMNDSFSNLIQLAPPRTCLLHDPQAEIQELFDRYVGPRAKGPLATDTRLRIKQRLTTALVRAGVWEQLEKRIPAERWTHRGDPFTFDYGYRPVEVNGKPNGHSKFIHALSLRRDTELAKVLVYTLEHVRREEPAELTAVVEGLADPGDEAAALSQRILEEGRIAVQPLPGIQEFAHSVRHELMG